MTVALNDGEVVNSADTVTGYNVGNISGDDDFVEGVGAIGLKCSGATCQIFTTTLGAGAPYSFASAGAEFGFHVIMWFNTKTPVDATSGIRVYFGDSVGVDTGEWYLPPTGFYKGGFITRVKDTAADFDVVTGAWTATGNPAQLTNIDEMGGTFLTITTLMGNFNNVQLDQFTIGTGLRVDVGTSGVPNTFETVRAQDEDTSYWGWWSSANGAVIGKGKLYIGPAAGTTASWFVDTAFAVIFADEEVAVGFYDFNMRGANTTCTWDLANISAANSVSTRWSLTLDSAMGSVTGGFTDTNGVYSGYDTITLNQYASMTGSTFIDGTTIIQNGATLDGISLLDANTYSGGSPEEFAYAILSDDPGLISNSSFTQGAGGHAIEITTPGTYTLTNNTYIGYGVDGTTDAVIYNNSGGAVTLAISGGNTPTVRNAAGSPESTTTITNAVTISVQGVSESTAIKVVSNETVGTITVGDIIFEKLANSTGVAEITDFNYEGAFEPSGLDVIVRARSSGLPTAAIQDDNGVYVDQTTAANSSVVDDMNLLPAVPVVNEDGYIFGHPEQFGQMKLDINTPGTGGFTITWQYWNGAWTNLSGVTDGTSSFSVSGVNKTSWTIPGDWVTTTINTQGPYYYVRALYTAGTVTVVPLGRKCALDVTRYIPFVQNRIIESTGLTVNASWQEDNIATF